VSSNSPRAIKQHVSKALVPALAAGLLVFAGCGSSSSSSSSSSTETTAASAPATSTSTSSTTAAPATGGASALKVAANPAGQLNFEPASLTAKAGKVSIDFTNKAALAHNLTVESSAGSVVGATSTFEGGSKTLDVTLKPGSYKFYCSVPGHRQGGMEGTITVQ
jgi:plastocyanin